MHGVERSAECRQPTAAEEPDLPAAPLSAASSTFPGMKTIAGTIFYDGDCAFCTATMRRWGAVFGRRGFQWRPFDPVGADEAPPGEVKLVLPGGAVRGGIDAWAVLFRAVWWMWPLGALLALPGFRWCGRRTYAWIARQRHAWGGRHDEKGTGAGYG